MLTLKRSTSANRRNLRRARNDASYELISEAAKNILDTFSNPTILSNILHPRSLTVPQTTNTACQNLLNVIATNMTDMNAEEIQFLSDVVFKGYVEILSR